MAVSVELALLFNQIDWSWENQILMMGEYLCLLISFIVLFYAQIAVEDRVCKFSSDVLLAFQFLVHKSIERISSLCPAFIFYTICELNVF